MLRGERENNDDKQSECFPIITSIMDEILDIHGYYLLDIFRERCGFKKQLNGYILLLMKGVIFANKIIWIILRSSLEKKGIKKI